MKEERAGNEGRKEGRREGRPRKEGWKEEKGGKLNEGKEVKGSEGKRSGVH